MSSLVLVDHAEAVPADQKDTATRSISGRRWSIPIWARRSAHRSGLAGLLLHGRGGKAPLHGTVELVRDRHVVAQPRARPADSGRQGLVQQANELPLADIGAGPYELRVTLTDGTASVTRSAPFTLLP